LIRLKLIKARSYSGFVRATREKPIVEVELFDDAQALVASGYFEIITGQPSIAEADDDDMDDDVGDAVPDYEDLSTKTKAELVAYADENGIDIEGLKTKPEILKAISIADGGSSAMIDLQQ
jgi:hypothetical protein